MPIFCDIRFTIGAGRCVTSSPCSRRSIEIAASWPCATAQMMFFGPNAASPPKNTCGSVDWNVDLVEHRHAPFVELDADVALDPREGVLLADGDQHVVAFEDRVGLAGGHQACAGPWRRTPARPSRSACR